MTAPSGCVYHSFRPVTFRLRQSKTKQGSPVVLWGTVVPVLGGTRVHFDVYNATLDFPTTYRNCIKSDFDSQGNLYLTAVVQTQQFPPLSALDLFKVSKEALAAGGQVVPQLVGRIDDHDPVDFRVSCDGFGYFLTVGGILRKIDLASAGAVWSVDVPQYTVGLTLTCNTSEVFGASYDFVSTEQVWRSRDGAPAELLDQVLPGPNVGRIPLAVAPGGAIYTPTLNGIGAIRTRVEPKLVNGTLTAQAYPCQQEGLNVLPSTTRWRPQKDTANAVVVNFTAAKGYVPSGLDITDPTGLLLANQNIAISGPVDPNADPGEYAITWSGPWSWTDSTTGQLKYHAVGNYTFRIRGALGGSPLDSDPSKPCSGAAPGSPTCSVVSLVEVTAVAMRDKPQTRGRVRNSHLGGPGGGWALFGEARNPSPNDQVGDEDKVEIVATVAPTVPDPRTQGPVTVYFRGLDVDDPSANTGPVDDEGFTYDNCLGGGCAVPSAGNVNDQDADLPVAVLLPTGQAEVAPTFQVSGRQGDNYRVSASTSSAWLGTNATGLRARQNSAFGEVLHVSGEPVLDPGGAKGPQVSEMLTVWRTLHLEVDSLASLNPTADQDAMDAGPGRSFTRLMSTRLDDTAAPAAFYRSDHPQPNDWRGADLTLAFHAADTYDVRDSDIANVTVNLGFGQPDLLNGQSDPFIVDRTYRLRDDALGSLSAQLDYGLATSLLARAYIQLVPLQQLPDQSTIPLIVDPLSLSPRYNRNLTGQLQYSMALPVSLPSTRNYWSVAVIKAFDPGEFDLDPPDKLNLKGNPQVDLGNTTRGPIGPSTQYRSAVFVETLRDLYAKPPSWFLTLLAGPLNPNFNTTIRRVTSHEIMHNFALTHRGNNLMCAHVNLTPDPAGDELNDNQISTVRRVDVPATPTDRSPCPR